MQPRRNIDWQVRRLLRKHSTPSHQIKEELWKGIAAALDEQQPVRKPRRGLAGGIAALLLIGSAAGVYFLSESEKPITAAKQVSPQAEARVIPSPAPEAGIADISTTAKKIEVQTSKKQKKNSIGSGAENITLQAPIITSIPVDGLPFTAIIDQARESLTPEKITEIREFLEGFSARKQDFNLGFLYTPLTPGYLKHKKQHKNTAARNGNSWMSLFMNIWDNPAYTGANGKLALSYEDNMSVFDYWQNGIYRDYFSIDGRIPKTPFSLGVYHDRALNAYSMKTGTGFTASARVLAIKGGHLTLGGGINRLTKKYFATNVHYNEPAEMTFGLKEVTEKRKFTTLQTAVSLEAGAWYQSKSVIAGVSVKDANEPLFGYTEEGERISRSWHVTGGYTLTLGKLQVMPLVEVEHNKLFSQGSASVIATFDDRISFGGAIQNINPGTTRGDKVAYAGIKAFNGLTVFASYGRSGEMAAKGINRHLVQSGIRFQLPR